VLSALSIVCPFVVSTHYLQFYTTLINNRLGQQCVKQSLSSAVEYPASLSIQILSRAGKNLGFLEIFFRFLGFLGFLGFNVHNAEHRYIIII